MRSWVKVVKNFISFLCAMVCRIPNSMHCGIRKLAKFPPLNPRLCFFSFGCLLVLYGCGATSGQQSPSPPPNISKNEPVLAPTAPKQSAPSYLAQRSTLAKDRAWAAFMQAIEVCGPVGGGTDDPSWFIQHYTNTPGWSRDDELAEAIVKHRYDLQNKDTYVAFAKFTHDEPEVAFSFSRTVEGKRQIGCGIFAKNSDPRDVITALEGYKNFELLRKWPTEIGENYFYFFEPKYALKIEVIKKETFWTIYTFFYGP